MDVSCIYSGRVKFGINEYNELRSIVSGDLTGKEIDGLNSVTVQASTKSRLGVQIIKINNAGDGRNISQVQISPSGG